MAFSGVHLRLLRLARLMVLANAAGSSVDRW